MSESPRIFTRPVVTLLFVMIAFGMDFMMFLSVGPRLIDAAGAPAIAGFLTTTMLLATVLIRWAYPYIEKFVPPKTLGAAAVGLMGVGALFFFVINADPLPMFIAAVFRGIGFGIITVLAQGLIVSVSEPEVRGRVASMIGIFGTVSAVLGPMVGLSLLDAGLTWAPGALAATFGVLAALMILSLKLPARIERAPSDKADTLTAALKNPQVLANVLVLLLCSVAWAGVASFMPLVLNPETNLPAQYFLLIYFLMCAVSRYVCGQLQDRAGVSSLTLIPAVIGIGAAMVIVGFSNSWIVTAAAAVLIGVSVGWMQNVTFYAVLGTPGHSSFVLSAAWTNGIDAGGMIGTLVLGGVAAAVGLDVIPFVIAVLALGALIPAFWLVAMDKRRDLQPEVVTV